MEDNNAKKVKVRVWNKIERDFRNLTKGRLFTWLRKKKTNKANAWKERSILVHV